VAGTESEPVPSTPEPSPAIAWRPILGVALVLTVVLLALSTRYGYHRDELYFLVAGRHLAWGYPDQPPLTPFLAWTMNGIGHGSLIVFRLPAALAAAAVTLLTALMARDLGGGRFAQALAAVTMALSTYVLLSGHLLVTSTIDLLVWVTVTWLVLRILRGGDPRLWLAVGVTTGLGFLNKELPIVLLLGLLVGVLLTPSARGALRSPWLWGGMAIAAAMWAPVLLWQADHGWPQFTLAGQIRDEYGSVGQRIGFFALQIVLFSIGAAYLWITGVTHLWRDEAWRTYRVFAWAWLFVLIFFVITAGQGYYPSGTYPVLIAAGAVVFERRPRHRGIVRVVVISSILLLPAALPILPASTLSDSPWSGPGETQLETVGWPHLVDVVAAAYATIPAAERDHAGVFTANYGEAGAVDRFGPAHGLPRAYSGHNGYGLWGPPPPDTGPVVVVWEDGPPSDFFDGCKAFERITGPVSNEETDRTSVYVCSGPINGWASAWPDLVHLSS